MTWVQSSRLNLRINGSLRKQWAVKPCFHSICFVSTWTWPWVESFHHLVIRECGYVSHSQIFGIICQIYYCPHACCPQNMAPLSRGSSTESSFKKSTKRKAPPPPTPSSAAPPDESTQDRGMTGQSEDNRNFQRACLCSLSRVYLLRLSCHHFDPFKIN